MDRVMFIFEQAKQFMRLNGNLHQWTGGYPSEEVLEADISSNSSFVCVDDQKEVVGTFCFRYGFSPEPTYNVIYDGGWLNEKPYGVIHRIASSGKVGGVFSACLEWCSRYVDNIRIDTHRDNRVMQELLLRHGFRRCGIIYLANGDERIAFQKRFKLEFILKKGVGNDIPAPFFLWRTIFT